MSSRNSEIQLPKPRSKPTTALHWFLARFRTCHATSEEVATHVQFNAGTQALWNHIVFYEEISRRPPFILRLLLTRSLRTAGEKHRVGAIVRCEYETGYLLKRINAIKPEHLLQFEVIEQQLGIENWLQLLSGCYRISASGHLTEVELTTKYPGFLHPRFLWRPIEEFLVRRLHNHILGNIRCAIGARKLAGSQSVAESFAREYPIAGGLVCTVSKSSFRR